MHSVHALERLFVTLARFSKPGVKPAPTLGRREELGVARTIILTSGLVWVQKRARCFADRLVNPGGSLGGLERWWEGERGQKRLPGSRCRLGRAERAELERVCPASREVAVCGE